MRAKHTGFKGRPYRGVMECSSIFGSTVPDAVLEDVERVENEYFVVRRDDDQYSELSDDELERLSPVEQSGDDDKSEEPLAEARDLDETIHNCNDLREVDTDTSLP